MFCFQVLISGCFGPEGLPLSLCTTGLSGGSCQIVRCALGRRGSSCPAPRAFPGALDGDLQCLHAIRGLLSNHLPKGDLGTSIGCPWVADDKVLRLVLVGHFKPSQNLLATQLQRVRAGWEQLLVDLHLREAQSVLIYGRLHLSTEHMTIVSCMRIRIMPLTICPLLQFLS